MYVKQLNVKPGSGIMFDQPVQPKVYSKFEQRDIKNSFKYEISKEKVEHKLKHNYQAGWT